MFGDYLMAFLIGGAICALAQFLLDQFRLLPIHITVLFVVAGAFLELFNAYDWLIKIGRAGALVQISSFGHSLTHAAVERAAELGYFGIFVGIFDKTGAGISVAILFGFFVSLVFRPKG